MNISKSSIFNLDTVQLSQKILQLKEKKFILFTDKTVWKIYSSWWSNSRLNFELWISEDGETGKNFDNYQKAVNFVLEKNIDRNTLIIAFGGGAVSDLAGFVAATLLRGVPWIAVPTTLLAMIDASIGGKTGINTEHGKNLVGAFHLPKEVWINQEFIQTQSNEEIQSGKGEILKYAFLSEGIARAIEQKQSLDTIVTLCAQFKSKLVEEDPYETSVTRKQLNLGHTFGHSVEKVFKLSHGIAVLEGLYLVLEIFEKKDFLQQLSIWQQCLGVLWQRKIDLNALSKDKKELILSFMLKDKKRNSTEHILFVVPSKRGEVELKSLGLDQLQAFLGLI